MKKILCYICANLKIVSTTIYSFVLIIIFLCPPAERAYHKVFPHFYRFGENRYMLIDQNMFYSEIIVVSLIYFAFMLFVIKK